MTDAAFVNEPPGLLRVLPVARRLGLGRGGALTVVALEIWEDGLVLSYVEAPPLDESLERTIPPRWAIEDDVGTSYLPGPGGSRGDARQRRGTVSFRPRPPDRAGVLRITPPSALAGRIEIPL